jgi:hypothetical protein
MARLSDCQVVDAPIPVDPQVMQRNAKSAGATVNWRDNIPIPESQAQREFSSRVRKSYGRDSHSDELDEEDEEPRTGRNRLLHKVLAAIERYQTRRATSKDRSMAMESQRSQGGGCGRSYACDVGNLSAANYVRMLKQERRRRGQLV